MFESRLVDLGPVVHTITPVLIHSLWQGILIGFLTAIALSLLKRADAKIRYLVSCGAMAAVILAVAVTLVSAWPDAHSAPRDVPATTGEGIIGGGRPVVNPPIDVAAHANDLTSRDSKWYHPAFSSYFFTVWVAGVMLLSLFHLIGWRRARDYVCHGTSPAPPVWQAQFRKLCDDLGVSRFVSLLSSVRVNVPCVVGTGSCQHVHVTRSRRDRDDPGPRTRPRPAL